MEEVNSPNYSHAGSERPDAEHYLFKVTISGEGRFIYKEQSYSLPAGYAFLTALNAPEMRYEYPEHEDAPWRFLYLAFYAPPPQMSAFSKQCGHVFHNLANTPIMNELLSYSSSTPNGRTLSSGAGSELVYRLLGTLADLSNQTKCAETDTLIDHALDIATNNLETNMNVHEWAGLLNISHAHFCRIFKANIGSTPLHYLQTQRMLHACALIKDTDMPIKNIAHRLGYQIPSHFNRIFKRLLGITPSDYRDGKQVPTPFFDKC